MSIPVTQHFSLDEFQSHDGQAYPSGWIVERLKPLCDVLEAVRRACGDRPMYVVSGYRSPTHNAAVGGAQHSQHMEGRAADVTVDGLAPSDIHAAVLGLYRDGQIPQLGGLGLYVGWVHVDVRPRVGDHLAQWRGTKPGAEPA